MLCSSSTTLRIDHQGNQSYGIRADITFNATEIETGNLTYTRGSIYNTPLTSIVKEIPTRLVANAYNTPSSLTVSGDSNLGTLSFETATVNVASTQFGLYVHSFDS